MLSDRLYRAWLRWLPAGTRADAADELAEIFRIRLARARSRGVGPALWLWIVALFDVLRVAVADRRRTFAPKRPDDGASPMTLTGFVRDLALACRNLLRAPARPALAVVTLAGGLAASIVAFVLVRDVLVKPLPFRQPDRIVRLIEISDDGRGWWPSYPNCVDWQRALLPVFSSVGCAGANPPAPVIVDGQAIKAAVSRASSALFETLGVQPMVGRLFTPDENRPGGAPAALVSAKFWREVLAGRPLEQASLVVGQSTAPVVGVLPDDFAFLGEGGAWSDADVWTPMARDTDLGGRTSHGYHTVARLRDGVTIERARAEMPALSAALKAEHHEATNADSVSVRLLTEVVTGGARSLMAVLMWAAGAVLFVSCLNFSAAVLARGLEQQRMLRLRLALGASRADLIRLSLAESLALSIPAVGLGLALAAGAIRWLATAAAGALPRLASLSLDGTAVAVAVATAAVSALLAGLVPAVILASRALAGGFTAHAAVGGTRVANRLWAGLVAAQIAVTLVLLAETGLLMRSFVEATHVDLGFRTDGVVAVELAMPPSRYAEAPARLALVRSVEDALGHLPGVQSVGVSSQLPTDTSSMMSQTRVAGGADADAIFSAFRLVDAGYFNTLGIPFTLKAGELTPGAAYVDQSVAQRLWNGASPLGVTVRHGMADRDLRVEGVAGMVREWDQGDEVYGAVYTSYLDQPELPLTMYVFVRTAASDLQRLGAAAALDPLVSVTVTPLSSLTAAPLRDRRLLATVAMVLAALACGLACAGTYAMVMFAVRRSRREAAIRLALGASVTHVRARFVRAALTPAALGLAVGIIAVRPAGALVSTQLFHVSPGDGTVLAGAVFSLALASVLAVLVPAFRSGRVDPVTLLRDE